MEYNIKEHGDALEKEFSNFINENFNTYAAVWKLYIGNKGNDTKANIEGYPPEREAMRQKFSEHTYTIFQSVISISRLINNEVFKKCRLNDSKEVLDLQDNLLLFFSHLGRIRDNVEEASACLIYIDTKGITKILEEFYHKRHIIVHGKTIPIIFKSNGEISIPVLSKSNLDISGWNHKSHTWQDISVLQNENLTITINQLFWELLPKLVDIFGKFKSKIEEELNFGGFKLKFENNLVPYQLINEIEAIKSTNISIYGIANNVPSNTFFKR